MAGLLSKLKSHWPFLLILVVALAVRFYNFPAWQGFDYDQEINAWLAKSIIIDHKPILIGPETSVGAMYAGPYFNYIIALFYLIGKMDPTWTILLNVILSAITISMVYVFAGQIFSKSAAIMSVLIYAFSGLFVSYDRVMWNPTVIPLVSLGGFYFTLTYLERRRLGDLVAATAFVGFMFHVHFSAVFLLAFFVCALGVFGGEKFFRSPLNYLVIIGVLAFFFVPLVIFDLRHNFINSSHLLAFFASSKAIGSVNPDLIGSVINIVVSWGNFIRSIFTSNYSVLANAFGTLALLFLALNIIVKKSTRFYKLTFFIFLLPTLGLSFYHGPLPSYYFLIPLPIFVMAAGDFLAMVADYGKLPKIFITILLGLFICHNLQTTLSSRSDLSLRFKKEAVKYVISDSRGQSFKVDFITDLGLNTGFKYLFWQQGSDLISDMAAQTQRTYKIIIPASRAQTRELSATFGSIGIAKM